ncbi:hypothetical protein [Rickettsia endosymbiont of Orchestes rusci]
MINKITQLLVILPVNKELVLMLLFSYFCDVIPAQAGMTSATIFQVN